MAVTDYKTLEPGIVGTSFTAKTNTGAGSGFAVPGKMLEQGDFAVVWQIKNVGDPAAALVVNLEGCIDDPDVAGNWFQLDTNNATAGYIRNKSAVAVRFIRLNIGTQTTPDDGVTGTLMIS